MTGIHKLDPKRVRQVRDETAKRVARDIARGMCPICGLNEP